MYEILFLGGFTTFEAFLEEVFLDLLVARRGRADHSLAIPRVTVKAVPIARELVFGLGRKYADWLPFERTVDRARMFFRGGRPFATVGVGQRELVDKAHVIRNAIAHQSRYSGEQFEKKIIAGTSLPPRERKPGGYLRGLVSGAPPLTRFENYTTALLTLAKELTAR
jgi:hypothetical protein